MEAFKIKKGAGYILLILILNSCSKELDYSGFFYSDTNVNERFEQSIAWNNAHDFSALNVPDENYSFRTAGDSHVGGIINLNKFITKTTSTEVSFIVFSGDLTAGHEEDYTNFNNELSNNLSLPSFLIAGNHDLFFDGWESFYTHFGSSTYTFTVSTPSATDLYICLDTGSGTLGNEQFDWLTDILKNTRLNYRNCVVFSHTNFFRTHHTSSTNMLVEELGLLLDLFAEYSVDLVIMGHDHQRSEEWFGNTLYLTLDALEDGFNGASYLEVRNQGGVMSHHYISID
jgi:predicted phosphodiesterase